MKVNVNLIQCLSDNNLLRHYAVFLRLKHIHVNSKVYNYSINRLSRQSGISRNGLRKYMEFFIANKWVRPEGDDIIFIGTGKLKALYGIKIRWDIKIERSTSINTILSSLRYQILINKQRKFNYIKKIATNRSNPQGKGALQAYKRAIKSKYVIGEGIDYLKITIKSLSKLLNVSTSSVSRLIKKYEILGKAKVIRIKHLALRFGRLKPVSLYCPEGYFFSKGYVIRVECNKYVFF